ncbi:MAG: hypothetical protein JW740_02600 [Candidatus Zambryskibacteria bacterium]|nr:hypothetical protein [Candidatus Zambryskibacteria bacterium]
MNDWQISSKQKTLLDSLFSVIDLTEVYRALDVGSGRTSIFYLTDRFKDLKITGIIYPEDEERIQKLKDSVKNTNYELLKTDIKDFDKNEDYDVILAHLFLGEAEKFAENKFEEVMNELFKIKTKYLVMVNLFRDKINYNLLLKKIAEVGNIIKVAYVKSEDGEDCIGLTIQFR